ncbi:MAG: succinate dehydrogenase iron-sulfur subunit [Planctomycetes bacterium]|nr:succinate dehydrogenase iron-sulfur subunit [Planctomycetota bacterium]
MSKHVTLKIKRQDNPHGGSYWEAFEVPYEDGMNMTTVLQRIAANPVTVERQPVAPVAYDCCCLEEVCGACTMVINGRVRQACSALVDSLLAEGDEIEVAPMTKFPVVRDLVVDRRRMFEALKRVKAWVRVDGYHDLGPGPRVTPQGQDEAYPLSRCMTCGCCVEACPQFNDHSAFIGPAAISQAVLFDAHPTGKVDRDARLEVIAGVGGITDCGNSQNCVKVCPKDIPLTTSLAKAGRDATIYKLRQWFGR